MTELVPYTENGHALAPAGSLREWADEARAAAGIATSLCKTSFVPEAFRDRPEEATAAILTGRELGLSPMASLRSIYVIKGTPAMYANALRAVVQSHGHKIWVEESTDTRAVVCGRRNEIGVGTETERVVWSIDRAKKAGLLSNQQYQKNPAAMLVARATAECARRVAADAIHGVPYSVEELTDHEMETSVQLQPAPKTATKRTAKRAAIAAAPAGPPEPDLEPPQTDAGADAPAESPATGHGAGATPASRTAPASPKDTGAEWPTPPPADEQEPPVPSDEQPRSPAPVSPPGSITKAQLRMLQASYKQVGIVDRQERLDHATAVIDRRIESANDLSAAEASLVIDALVTAENDLQAHGEYQQGVIPE